MLLSVGLGDVAPPIW